MTERLFLLNPNWHDDQGGPWFCPAGAYVEGVLAFYPRLRDALDVVYLDHPRPRQPVSTFAASPPSQRRCAPITPPPAMARAPSHLRQCATSSGYCRCWPACCRP